MNGSRALAIVLIVIGIIGLAIGVVYFTVAVDKLPSFLGHITTKVHGAHRTKRGIAGVAVGGILVIVGAALLGRRTAPEEE